MPPPTVEFVVDGLTFTMTPDILDAVRRGERDPDVGYMQGRIKVAGDMARFYGLLPLAASREYADAIAQAVGPEAERR